MTAILGMSAFYHDSAAALVLDGAIVAAAHEERFTRVKHDARFPRHAIAFCLREAGLAPKDLDYIAFYEKPLTKFDRLLESYFAYAPRGFTSFCRALPIWLKEKLHTPRLIRDGLGAPTRAKLLFLDHHESHAASAYFPSPFEDAAILTIDGVGEWTTTAFGSGNGNRLQLTHRLEFPHSLGLLYSAFTYYCGFRVNSGEYKLMGLAPFGRPAYRDLIERHLIDRKPDGSFRLNMAFFNYAHGLTMTNHWFHRLFGGPPRAPEEPIEARHMDLAASIQTVTEDVILDIARAVHRETKSRRLVLAGGVALNCVANGRLLREGPFEDVWIQPAAGDAGGALGAAFFVWHQLLEKPRIVGDSDSQRGSFLGPQFADSEILHALQLAEMPCQRFDDEGSLIAHVAGLLANGQVVGWFSRRMEFGPRALGARSILADPRSPTMQSTLNRKIKFREGFRPFAPAVPREHAADWFDLPPGKESPYMLFVAPVKEEHRLPCPRYFTDTSAIDTDPCRRVQVPRSSIPAVTHVDYSARVQTVDERRNPRFYRLLQAFYELTGCPMLVNTSFNVRGEPIVCTPQDAIRCYEATEMDALVLENYVLEKGHASPSYIKEHHLEYLAQFQPD